MIEKHIIEKEYVVNCRSLSEVAGLCGCSIQQVRYWLAKYGIKTRTISDAIYKKLNPNGDPFEIKNKFSKNDLILLGLGLGLWWGEGSKRHMSTIRLGNTDPQLIKKFIQFLREICGVSNEKLRFGLQVFSDMNPVSARRFWIRTLGIKNNQIFPKTIVTPARSIGTYKHKSRYGVLTVHCSNVKLRKIIDQLMTKYADVAQLAERVHGRP